MIRDAHDLPLTTRSEVAAAHYREGVLLTLTAWPGVEATIDRAIAADPDFALGHAARARLYAMAGQPDQAQKHIAAAHALAHAATERERSHVAVLAHIVEGRSADTLDAALAHADRWPRDVLILSLPLGAFGLFAFSGMADHDQARVDLCAQHANHFDADDWWFLTNRGWALAENGDVARGREMVARAFALRPQNANAMHALAHAMFESGAGDDAERLIADWLPTYDRCGVLHGHIAWHAALIALDRGDAKTALSWYARHVRPPVSQGPQINVISDGASLLWRLDLYGHGAGAERWSELARYARDAFPTAGHAFIDAHMALIESATGEDEAIAARIAELEALVARNELGAGPVAPGLARAVRAFAESDYAGCVRLLEPLAAEVVRIGGSGAQREVFEDTLLVALMRSGETATAASILDERLHRRASPRDRRWRDSLAR